MIDNKVELIKDRVEEIMQLLEIPITESNKNTPIRVAKMFANELFKNRNNYHIEDLDSSMKLFDNEHNSKDMIIVENIDFTSICEHHWLPFMGKIRVGYIPNKHLVGLSKIPRTVKFFSQKPQLQERLVKEIGDYLFDKISPEFLIIQADATHTCVACRGAESGCSTNTTYRLGNISEKYVIDFFIRGVCDV